MISKVPSTNAWADFEVFWQHKHQNTRSPANNSKSQKQVKETDLRASTVQCDSPVGNIGNHEVNRVKTLPQTRNIHNIKLNIAGDDNPNNNLAHHHTDTKKSDNKSPDNEGFMADLKLNDSAITSSLHKNNLQLIFNVLLAVNIGLIIRLCHSRQVKIDNYKDGKGIMEAFSDRFNHQSLMFAGAT